MTSLRSRFTTTGWYYLVVLLFILAGSILQQLNLLMLLFSLMVFPLAWNWGTTRRCVASLSPRRNAPVRLFAGTSCRATVQLQNRRRRRCWSVLVRDRLVRIQPQPQSFSPVAWTLQVPPRGTAEASYQPLQLPRGVYQWEELELESSFPLGLVRSIGRQRQVQRLVVYPPLGQLTQAWRTRGGLRICWSQGKPRRHSLLEGEFYALRDYLPGDNRRWIHWRSSARRDELIVRQFQESPSRRLCLVLDLWSPEFDKTESQVLEDLLSFVATVLEDQVRQSGSELWLVLAAGSVQQVRGPANRDTLHRAWELLAGAWPQAADPLPQLQQQWETGREHRTELLVVSLTAEGQRRDKLQWLARKMDCLLWVDPQRLSRFFQPPHQLAPHTPAVPGNPSHHPSQVPAGGRS